MFITEPSLQITSKICWALNMYLPHEVPSGKDLIPLRNCQYPLPGEVLKIWYSTWVVVDCMNVYPPMPWWYHPRMEQPLRNIIFSTVKCLSLTLRRHCLMLVFPTVLSFWMYYSFFALLLSLALSTKFLISMTIPSSAPK